MSIVIIGGGPAGMMAAISAGSAAGARAVTLVEKNSSLGKKLLLTGNGRCNFTNATDLETFLAKFSKEGPFLRDTFKHFFNRDLRQFFEERGLKSKVDNQGKVSPANDKATSVLCVLEKELKKNNVTILYNSAAAEILLEGKKIRAVKLKNGKTIPCESAIIATGGASYPQTGSTGDGYALAKKLGHTILAPKPGLVPLVTRERYPASLEGLALRGVMLRVRSGKKKLNFGTGDIIFTSNGLSGPLILSVSGTVSDLTETKNTVNIDIDLFPKTPKENMDPLLLKHFKANPSKNIINSLGELLPQRLADLFLELAPIDGKKKGNQLTHKERAVLVSLCKEFCLTITGTRGLGEAMITRGGVSTKEIDPRRMASRLVDGLYFAGEIIDIAGDTGGYNLQAAFSTGFLAGLSAAARKSPMN